MGVPAAPSPTATVDCSQPPEQFSDGQLSMLDQLQLIAAAVAREEWVRDCGHG